MSLRNRVFLAVLCTACRSSTPGEPPSPDVGSPTETPTELNPTVSAWTISPTSQEYRYTSVTSAILETAGLPQSVRDTIVSTINFSISIARDITPSSYSARIEAISTQGGTRIRAAVPPATVVLPFVFTGHLEVNRITIELPKVQTDISASCVNETLAAIPVVQRSLVLIPLQLRTGMTWTDSAVSSVCSGPVLVSLSSIRTYQVKGQTVIRGRTVILLDQQSRTSFTGEGAQEQHRIRVRGDGTGKSQLAVDAMTGVLVDATANNTTLLTVTASGRDQRFTQTSRERVTQL
jgi:hypothetical protein